MIISESEMGFNVRKRLDELARGECSEDDFLQNVFDEPRSTPDAAWDVLAHIDQHYRRGHLSIELFRSIESKIARKALKDSHYGRTVDLVPESDPQPEPEPEPEQRAIVPAPVQNPKTPELSAPIGGDEARPAEHQTVEDLRGTVLAERYVIESVLGDGGMGRVFRALDRYRCDLPDPYRHVALKVLHQKISDRPELLARLRREFFCAQSLSHQNIVNVYETGSDGDLAFFTMELLDGEPLSAVIDRSRPRPVERKYAFQIIRAIGAGLAHAHAHNMVHADLKPHNVMITSTGEIRILDFGASRPSVRCGPAKSTLQCSATPAYACCELLAGKPADPRDDVFALACVSFELLAGRHPFDRRSSIQARDAGLKPSRPDGLTGRQWRTLRMGLAWRRSDRSMPVTEWVARLTTETVTPPQLPQEREPRTRSWQSIAAQRVAVWSLFALVVGLLALNGRRTHGNAGLARVAPPVPVAANVVRQAETPRPAASVPAAPAVRSVAAALSAAPATPRPSERKPNVVSLVGFRVPPGQGFAEVNVRRSDPDSGDSGFVWWTVAGSAVPGMDFIAQAPTSQAFSRGRRVSNLFVRVLPNPTRTAPRNFHVEIGKANSDDISAPIARATIMIPPQP